MAWNRFNSAAQINQGRESPMVPAPLLPTEDFIEEKWPHVCESELEDDAPIARISIGRRWGRMDRSA